MINIFKTSEVPEELTNKEAQKYFKQIIIRKEVTENDCKIYRKVKNKLFDLYNGKCCYCETKLSGTEIEHFRPKSKYYWLVYSWDNLLPICSQCNKNKGNDFNTINKLTINQNFDLENCQNKLEEYNQIEIPLIANPEIDTIDNNTFIFNENGFMLSEIEKFAELIKILKLNRYELLYNRKKLFDELQIKIESTYIDHKINNKEEMQKIILQDLIIKSQNINNDYIALRKFLVKYYIDSILQTKEQK